MRERLQEFNGPWMLSDKFCFKGSLILRAQGLGYFPNCFEILIVLAGCFYFTSKIFRKINLFL